MVKRRYTKTRTYQNGPFGHPVLTPPRAMTDEHLKKSVAVNDATLFEWAHRLRDVVTKISLQTDKLHPDPALEQEYNIARSTFNSAATNRRKLLDEVQRRLNLPGGPGWSLRHKKHGEPAEKPQTDITKIYKPYHRNLPGVDQT